MKLAVLARKAAFASLAMMHVFLGFFAYQIHIDKESSDNVAKLYEATLDSIIWLIGILLFGKAAMTISNRFGQVQPAHIEETTSTVKTVTTPVTESKQDEQSVRIPE